MLQTAYGLNGCVTAPHRLASKAGVDVLEAGGSAVEAMVAAAAVIAVVYPHMNSIGGDGFWLIKKKGETPVAIDAAGRAAEAATLEWYRERGYDDAIPARGAHAALTVPGTISGWGAALALDLNKGLTLRDLLSSAINLAQDGTVVTKNQEVCTREKMAGLKDVPGFADIYLDRGEPPAAGSILKQEALAETFRELADEGLVSYYKGALAETHARFLQDQGSPLVLSDFHNHACEHVTPLQLDTSVGRVYNMPPPTQGMASLMLLGIYDRLQAMGRGELDNFTHVHQLIEATKQAFIVRNRELGDPSTMACDASEFLQTPLLDDLAARVSMSEALEWPHVAKPGDTIWMGAIDRDGTSVSFIQSVFWEFGSGLTCPDTGVFFQNRGAGFSLAGGPNQLRPFKKPFHTLNPAMAVLSDGRTMVYGTMGGEGQPQTQAALFTRYAYFGDDLQTTITKPRWLLGKTWGDDTTSLKVEADMDGDLVTALKSAGHNVEILSPLNDLMGHAGAIVLHENGIIEGANDPRSDGLALAF